MPVSTPPGPAAQPFFIIGSPRSGTSLLRSLLNVHPSLCVAPECGFLLWLQPAWGAERQWDAPTRRRFRDAVASSRKFETWGLSAESLGSALDAATIGSYADAAQVVYRSYAAARGKPEGRVGDKNNYYIAHIDQIRAIYDQARFIHIVRDVRDVVCSYLEIDRSSFQSDYRPRLPTRPEDIATQWRADNEAARRQLQGTDCRFLRYEDIVRDAAACLNPLFLAWGLPALADLGATSHLASLDEPAAMMAWKGKLAGPMTDASMGRYRNELEPQTIAAIERIAAPLMREFGHL